MSKEVKRAGNWRLTTRRSTGGGLFALEERVRFEVHNVRTGELVLSFRGSVDYTYASPGWEFDGTDGVLEVELRADRALVHCGGEPRVYLLPPRAVSNAEIDALLAVYTPLRAAIDRYRYEVEWSSDVAIPQAAIEASSQRMWDAWRAFQSELETLGLAQMAHHNLRWPKRVRGGKARIQGLDAWMQQGGHVAPGPAP